MSAQRPSLAAVAARAGVSPSTASLAFSGAGPVAPATRERVLEAARELGYTGPDPMARSLRQGRSGIVAVIVGERLLFAFRDPVTVGLLDGLAEELTPHGSGLLLFSGADRSGPTEEQVARMPMDVVIFATCGWDEDPLLGYFVSRGVPVIAVDGGPHRDDVGVLDIDDYGGSLALAHHLAELGHERLATVVLPLRLDGRRGPVDAARRAEVSFDDARRRLQAVEDVFGPVRAVEAATNLVEEGEAVAAELLDAATPRPTAIVAQSDLLAVGVIRAAQARGLQVPEDLSVVGFDGIDTRMLDSHELTTVEQPIVEKGRAVGRMAAEYLAGGRPANVRLPIRVRIGNTTAPPPAQ